MSLLTLRLHKLNNLQKVVGGEDGEEKEQPALSLNQLANLFGFLKTDADGEILSVEADYDDEMGGGSGEGDEMRCDDGEGGPTSLRALTCMCASLRNLATAFEWLSGFGPRHEFSPPLPDG